MGQKVFKNTNYSIYGHTFFAITDNSSNFLPIGLKKNYGYSRDYYLSVGHNEFWFWALITIFDFLGPVWA